MDIVEILKAQSVTSRNITIGHLNEKLLSIKQEIEKLEKGETPTDTQFIEPELCKKAWECIPEERKTQLISSSVGALHTFSSAHNIANAFTMWDIEKPEWLNEAVLKEWKEHSSTQACN
jgi:hypothetical protein